MFTRYFSVISFICILVLGGCKGAGKDPDYVGTWRGTVLIVDVQFSFTKDAFIQKTYSLNNVMVGGTRGTITAQGNTLNVHQTGKYHFDNQTNSGQWADEVSDYTIAYQINDRTITLKPSTSTDSMVLTRE